MRMFPFLVNYKHIVLLLYFCDDKLWH